MWGITAEVSGGIEEAVEIGVEELVFDSWGIEKVSSGKESNTRTEARSIHQVSRSYREGRKNLMVKTPPGDFQVTTPETPLLSQQAVTSKESQVPYQPIVELLPNTQSDMFCSDSSPFWYTAPKYVTNQLRRSQYATSITNLKRLLAANFFSSSTWWRSGRCLVTEL